jgi:hypothetical protein
MVEVVVEEDIIHHIIMEAEEVITVVEGVEDIQVVEDIMGVEEVEDVIK